MAAFSTCGTIAGKGASSTDLAEYPGSTLLGSKLLTAVREIDKYAEVAFEQVANVASLAPEVWKTLAQRINVVFLFWSQ